jgi:alginate O-acetyltransferase complex protein AlgI
LYQELKPQLQRQRPSAEMMFGGFNRFFYGILKKVLLADRLAPAVRSVFDHNDQYPGITILAGAVIFTIQLYFDFSAYCDMAVGLSRMLGVIIPENFNFPFRASSVTVFWRRWHMSLIGFFTQYVFYPLSYKLRRLGKHGNALAIVVVFALSSLWHGFGVVFVLWASCHITYLLMELYAYRSVNALQDRPNVISKFIHAMIVILMVAFSNIFFRSVNMTQSENLVSLLFGPDFFPENWAADFVAPLAVGGHQIDHFNFIITLVFTLYFLFLERRLFALASRSGPAYFYYFAGLLLLFLFGVFDSGERFIYMQF